MKKALYIIITLIVFILVSSLAVTCNMCSAPFKTDTEIENDDGIQSGQGGETSNPGQSQNGNTAQDNNNTPSIDSIEISGINVELMKSQGYFDNLPSELPEGAAIVIDVKASDEDGDELNYRFYDSLGTDFNVKKIDNNHAEITWIVPLHTGGYTLTLEVSDGRGGTDSYSVDMNFQ